MRTYSIKNWQKIKDIVGHLNLYDTGEAHGSDTRRRVLWDDQKPVHFLAAKEKAQVIGWCIKFSDKETHVFVKRNVRRKGYGSRLLKRMARETGRCKVVPWNAQARAFFGMHLSEKIVPV